MGIARRPNGRCHARVKIDGRMFNIGSYPSEDEAHAAVEAEYERVRNGTSPLLRAGDLVDPRVYAASIGVPYGTLKRWSFEGMPTVVLNGRSRRIDPKVADGWIATHHPNSVAFARESTVYFVRRDFDGAIKIGWTSDVVRRIKELRKCGVPMVLLAAVPGDKPLELSLHQRFARERIDPNDEWFVASERLVEFVRSLGRAAA